MRGMSEITVVLAETTFVCAELRVGTDRLKFSTVLNGTASSIQLFYDSDWSE
jgi:hypothetical protein